MTLDPRLAITFYILMCCHYILTVVFHVIVLNVALLSAFILKVAVPQPSL